MHLTPAGVYVASRHADVAAILRDKRFGKDFLRRPALMLKEPVYRSMSHWILQLDPPHHGRLRNVMVRAFTAGRVEDMRPRIQQIVDELIDRLQPQGHMDLIADFAFRLPVTVICDMLGIPEQDRQVFFSSSRARFARLLEMWPLSRAEVDQQNSYNLAMAKYFGRLFELRRREPGDDITTYLVQAEENGRLTNEELIANVILLFDAGHETTVNLIGNGLLALHRNPDQLRLLKNDPSLIANAIEELLRYDASVQAIGRTALEYVDEIAGISLEKGQSVICLLGSANRDPAVYSDPDRLDVTRPNVRLLSFGGGIHHCVGAQLARIEGEIAIATLLRRLPDLQLHDLDHPDWRQTFVLRGLTKLLASW
jgi:cytochrome P450